MGRPTPTALGSREGFDDATPRTTNLVDSEGSRRVAFAWSGDLGVVPGSDCRGAGPVAAATFGFLTWSTWDGVPDNAPKGACALILFVSPALVVVATTYLFVASAAVRWLRIRHLPGLLGVATLVSIAFERTQLFDVRSVKVARLPSRCSSLRSFRSPLALWSLGGAHPLNGRSQGSSDSPAVAEPRFR